MITPEFIQLHVPKTAGSFMRGVIWRRRRKWRKVVPFTHTDIKVCRKEAEKHGWKNIPSFCTVRNPWDWHISNFGWRQHLITEDKKAGKALHEVDKLKMTPEGFKQWMMAMKKIRETGKSIVRLDGSRPGSQFIVAHVTLSSRHAKVLCGEDADYIVRFENLQQDLKKVLYPISKVMRKNPITQEEWGVKVRPSQRGEYKQYYDQELIDLVADWDKDYIKKFGYNF